MEPATLLALTAAFSAAYASSEAQSGAPAASPAPEVKVVVRYDDPSELSRYIETMIADAERGSAAVSEHRKSLCRGYKMRLFDIALRGAYTPEVGRVAVERCQQIIAKSGGS